MKRMNWMHWLLAAMLVLVGGVAITFAETVTLKMTQRDGEQVELDLNGEVHLVELEDLADGEVREFAAGERTVQVRRVGDELQVTLDGEEFGGHDLSSVGSGDMFWVTEGGETHHMPGHARRVIVMKDGEAAEGEMKTYAVRIETDEGCEDCEGCEDAVNIDVERIDELVSSGDTGALDDHHVMVFKGSEEEGGPVVIKKIRAFGGDVVRYRCEETGSELTVKKDDAVSDSYVCPATGCVMERMDEPEMKVIRVEHKRHKEEGGEHD